MQAGGISYFGIMLKWTRWVEGAQCSCATLFCDCSSNTLSTQHHPSCHNLLDVHSSRCYNFFYGNFETVSKLCDYLHSEKLVLEEDLDKCQLLAIFI